MNMHISIGDKFVTVKPMWSINKGSKIVVTNVSKDGIVSFESLENDEHSTHSGYMDSDTFLKYFEKIEENTDNTNVPEITDDDIADIMENSEFEIFTTFDKCTIVSCRLPNGFVITESSSCVDPRNYDSELAEEICFDKIADKIAELEAYRLQQYMWEEGMLDCDCCDNCEVHDCPHNSNT